MNTPRLRLLSLALLAAGMAQAQQAQQAPQQLDKVVVTGQAASLRSALDKQRNATGVVSIVHADGIGQLPDANAAEALARLPGVSVERDQGEGRFIRVRGLGPDLNAVSINGSLAPAAEADRRAPGLDLLPAGLIRSLEVHKTLLPEQDAQALGGLVAVNTLSAFDLAGPLLALELGANHDANAGKSRPRASLVHAQRLGRFGSAVAISFDERRFASDNVETGGAWDGNALEEFDRRRYEITRERIAAAFNLDWREGAQQAYLRGFASRFTDDEARQSHALAFEDAQTEGQTGAAESLRSLKSRREQSRMEALSLGGQWPLAEGLLRAELGASRASESKPDGIGAAEFVAEFDEGIGFRDSRGPRLIAPAAVNQAAGYELDKLEFEQGLSRDRARHLKLDLSQALGETIEMKLGLKLGRRTKTNAEEITAIDAGDLDDAPFAMSGFLLPGRVDYAFGDFGPGLAAAPLYALRGGLNLADFR
ncbi:MAG: TonB-dependent receptor plug domain-containing protein, partial [Inhella sp.]